MMMPYMKRHGADNLWKVGARDEEIEGEKVGTYVIWRHWLKEKKERWRRRRKKNWDGHVYIQTCSYIHTYIHALHTTALTQRLYQYHTHIRFYIQTFYVQTLLHAKTLLHIDAFTRRRFYTQMPLHTGPFTHAFTHRRFYTRRFYTQMSLHTHTDAITHTDAFTHRRFYTQTLSHTGSFIHRHFYTQTLLLTDAFTHKPSVLTQTYQPGRESGVNIPIIPAAKKTQTLLHRDAFTHKHVYTQTLLHTDAFTHFTQRPFRTQPLLRTDTFTHNRFYTDALTHTPFYTQTRLNADAFTHTLLHTNTFTRRSFTT